jgi:mannose-6-phosphate isomerase-like protein (cupin superfamily)
MLDTGNQSPKASDPHWSEELIQELHAARGNGRVGSRLVDETDTYRIWLIEMAPGDRLPFHTHVLNYFWTATSAGRALSRYADGKVVEMDYAPGLTRHMAFGAGESMTHDLENTGDTVLSFVTVEDKRSANEPLPL